MSRKSPLDLVLREASSDLSRFRASLCPRVRRAPHLIRLACLLTLVDARLLPGKGYCEPGSAVKLTRVAPEAPKEVAKVSATTATKGGQKSIKDMFGVRP